MAWVYLLVAGILEIVWASLMKQSNGFRVFWPTVWTIITMIFSFGLLAVAMRTLPLGTAYAIWTGIGAVGTVIVGIVYYHESADIVRLSCVTLIVLGILGLKFLSPAPVLPR